MQKYTKYAGTTQAKYLDTKLVSYYEFNNNVITIVQTATTQTLLKAKVIETSDIYLLVKDNMTTGYLKTVLDDLYRDTMNGDVTINNTWHDVTHTEHAFMRFVAQKVFKRKELNSMTASLFSIPIGALSVAYLHRKVHTYLVSSGILSEVFKVAAITPANAAAAFLKALDPKVEKKISKHMEELGYTETTEGLFVWLKLECESIENTIYPGGHKQSNAKYNSLEHVNEGGVEINPDTQKSDSEWETDDSDEEYANEQLNFVNRTNYNGRKPPFKRRFQKYKQKINALEQTINNLTNNTTTNPSLKPTEITDEIRDKWFENRLCINCGNPSHKLIDCTKPKDNESISRLFNRVKLRAQQSLKTAFCVPDIETAEDTETAEDDPDDPSQHF